MRAPPMWQKVLEQRARPYQCRLVLLCALACAQLTAAETPEPIHGFLAPLKSVDVATAETGVLRRILVHEGDTVEAGQVMAQLDDEVHAAVMAEAERAAQSQGRLAAAHAELIVRRTRLEALEVLLPRGSARPEEVTRARADLDIAAAQLRALEDERDLKQLEFQRAKQLWERRTVRAPSNGIVVQVAKEEGEFIGPNDPRLLTIVQLDRLLATFAVPSSSARQVRHGQVVTVGLPESNTQVQGTVKLIAPVVEGKSGTMRIEVCVDNSRRQYLSGEPCTLVLDGQRQPTSGSSRNSQ